MKNVGINEGMEEAYIYHYKNQVLIFSDIFFRFRYANQVYNNISPYSDKNFHLFKTYKHNNKPALPTPLIHGSTIIMLKLHYIMLVLPNVYYTYLRDNILAVTF